MAAPSPRSSLPQGFSVYQPAVGAPLQFFPALGTPQLDDLINAYVPGTASVKDKRASISIDFLHYATTAGQTFKFYPAAPVSPAESPVTGTPPSLDSASSSFNVSPVTSSWDWSAAASVSSRSSTQRRRPAKAASSSTTSRHQTADLSNLPGMKILTKDGLDVTNLASRGSKTKEQRDHAHLMRIIKACDSCRRKKIRCDPSHKRRAGSTTSKATTGSRSSKKTKSTLSTPAQSQPSLEPSTTTLPSSETVDVDDLEAFLTSSLDPDLSLSHLESLPGYPWDDFMQFPPMDATADYDFYLDPENYFTSQSSVSSSSASPFEVSALQSLQEPGAPPGADTATVGAVSVASPPYSFLDQHGSAGDYTDFNLFSPGSSFSEDDRMISVSASSSELLTSQPSQISQPGWDAETALPSTAGDPAGSIDNSSGLSIADPSDGDVFSSAVSAAPANRLGSQMSAEEKPAISQQQSPLSEQSALAMTAQGVATALILLTASVVSALQWAHVAVAVLAFMLTSTSILAGPTRSRQSSPALEGKLSQCSLKTKHSSSTRMAGGIASMRYRVSATAFSGTPGRAYAAAAMLRG